MTTLTEKLSAHSEWMLEKLEEVYPKYYRDDTISQIDDDLKEYEGSDKKYALIYTTAADVEVWDGTEDDETMEEDNYKFLEATLYIGTVEAISETDAIKQGANILSKKGLENFDPNDITALLLGA